jgi:hypothetical protein
MKCPQIFQSTRLIQSTNDWPQANYGQGKGWRPARPVSPGGLQLRLKAAWLVLAGKADAVVWGDA